METAIKNGLDNAIYNDVLHGGQQLQIVGYTDYVGTGKSNDVLSKSRATTVKKFLLGYGFEDEDITICIGKGEVERAGLAGNEGFARDRRVDIIILPKIKQEPVEAVAETKQKPSPKPLPEIEVAKAPSVKIEDLSTAKPNEVLRLENFYFYPGRHVIRPESAGELTRLNKVMTQNPTLKISIEGHVCCVAKEAGDALDIDTHELALSLNRAREVYSFLIKRGIDDERLSFKGWGGSKPLVVERTEDDADKNRRVEIRVIEN